MDGDVLPIFAPCCCVYGLMLMGGAGAAGATRVLMESYVLEETIRSVGDEHIAPRYADPPGE